MTRQRKTYDPRIVDTSTGVCYYEVNQRFVDLCHACAATLGHHPAAALGGSRRPCRRCGRVPVKEATDANA